MVPDTFKRCRAPLRIHIQKGGGLETEFKNTIQYNLGTKIYLDNQKDKEEIEEKGLYQIYFRDKTCVRRIVWAKKGCSQVSINDNFFDDICCILFKMVDNANAKGTGSCGTVKKSQKVVCLVSMEIFMKNW